jgi:hypothetical protein
MKSLILFLFIAFVADAAPITAQAQSQEAMRRFRAGMEHFEQRRFKESIAEFDRAIAARSATPAYHLYR